MPIANSCEQVRTLRDSKGKVTEPLWYACLGVLAFAEDGEQYAHEWSSGDARYTEEETQGRLDRARQLSGATTCRRFHELKYEVCERCPRWGKITSPIVLGHRQDQGRATTESNWTKSFTVSKTRTSRRISRGNRTGQVSRSKRVRPVKKEKIAIQVERRRDPRFH